MTMKIAKISFVLFTITIISKALSFFMTMVFSYYFGADMLTDAYYAANTVPNLINTSLLISALTLFIPVYTKCQIEEGIQRANEFTSNILNMFVIFNIVLVVAVCLSASILSKLVAPGFSNDKLLYTKRFIILLSMSFPFTVAIYVLNNLCNANHNYIFPASLTLLNHCFVLVLTIFLAPIFGLYSYPLIATGGWIIQLLFLYFWSRKRLFQYKFFINLHDKYLSYMLKLSIPVMITTATDQINLAADNIISSDLSGGAISCLGYAHRIFYSINGILSSSLLTVYYPIIAKQYTERNREAMDMSIKRYFEIMLLFALPITSLLLINSDDIIKLLFNRGAMKLEDISCISALFMIYVSGLFFINLKEFVTRSFYIIGDTKLPTIINILCVAVNICLSITLKQQCGIYGIAIATTFSTAIFALLECAFLVKKTGGCNALKVHKVLDIKVILQIVLSCLLAGVMALIVRQVNPIVNAIFTLLLSGIVYTISVIICLYIFKNEYVNIILRKNKKVERLL